MINRAKKKIERGKVRFDATIAKLQKERKQMMDTGASLKAKASKAEKEGEKLEELNLKVKAKLNSYQELYDHNQRMIVLGNRFNDIADRYFDNGKKRPLISICFVSLRQKMPSVKRNQRQKSAKSGKLKRKQKKKPKRLLSRYGKKKEKEGCTKARAS